MQKMLPAICGIAGDVIARESAPVDRARDSVKPLRRKLSHSSSLTGGQPTVLT